MSDDTIDTPDNVIDITKPVEEKRPDVERLTRDLARAAATLSDEEARFLVDAYYMMQEDRKRTNNQLGAMVQGKEPCSVLNWLSAQSSTLEQQIKRALDKYTDAHAVGVWLKTVYGIGPVIAAGLMAHIDITKAPTVGHIWRYAGLDPTSKWEKGQKRPWNASLKTLCWKIGQSFMKLSNSDECYYGKLYRDRKAIEQVNSDSGKLADQAAAMALKVGKNTEAYKHYSQGRLSPGHIDARARRYAVKQFLSDLHAAWYRIEYGHAPPKPYPIAILNHAHERVGPY